MTIKKGIAGCAVAAFVAAAVASNIDWKQAGEDFVHKTASPIVAGAAGIALGAGKVYGDYNAGFNPPKR